MLRKQYHFRDVGPDVHIWDVHRLIRMSRGLRSVLVPLSQIAELDENWWHDDSDIPTPRSLAAHMALVRDADPAFPILLCPEGRVMDGMHRVVRALLDGHGHIAAIRFPTMPAPDHVNVAADALPYPDEAV